MKPVVNLVGDTPLIEIFGPAPVGRGRIFAKCENKNPGGSIKDRIARQMLLDAIENKQLDPEHPDACQIIEATSGNTAIGLALMCRAFGFPLSIYMPENMTEERKTLIRAYGAELVLTPASLGMVGAVEASNKRYDEIIASGKRALKMLQFENPSNPKAHFLTTGPEIIKQLEEMDNIPTKDKKIAFVAGFGTGGTVSGCSKSLKNKFGKDNVFVVAVEPAESALVTTGKAGPHKISGIGANFIPKNLDKEVIDRFMTVTSADAMIMAKRLASEEALLVGVSSGANVVAALKIATETGKDVVTILCDSGERYFSTGLFN